MNSLALKTICVFALISVSLQAKDAEPVAPGEFDLHEWGVFTVARNDRWAMSDLRAEWASFPKEFYRIWPDLNLPWHGAVRKPVIFLHGKPGMKVDLSIKFSAGRPLVWWPAAAAPVNDGQSIPMTDSIRFAVIFDKTDTSEQEEGHVGERGRRTISVAKDHWISALRSVECSPIYTFGGHSRLGTDIDCEKFIYYDGVMNAPATPTVARDKAALTLNTENDFELLDVMVLDRSIDGKTLSIGKAVVDKIAAGKQTTRIDMVSIPAGAEREARQAELLAELQRRLVTAGLNADEASSLVTIWRDGLLDDEGLVVLYRIPQETYEKWLPLTAKPAPKKSVRVGLVVHSHLEPELDGHVETLIKQLSSDDFKLRDEAKTALAKIGGAAFPMLEKNAKNPDAETAHICREILKALDTRPALNVQNAGAKLEN
jgi:hypothetical protein